MDFERTNLIIPPASNPTKPPSRVGLILGIVILIVVVIVLLVLVIIFATRKTKTVVTKECSVNTDCTGGKTCSNGTCVVCTSPPSSPTSVSVTYDELTGTASITWPPIGGVSSYNIYRKLEDPSVGVNNYTQKVTVSTTSKIFTSLDPGTHYFVVTSLNDCGESQPSSPAKLAPSCSTIPAAMAAPVVTQLANNCAALSASESVQIAFTDMNIPTGGYIVRGNGQVGSVSEYFYLIQGSAYSPAVGINLKCGTTTSQHTVTQITDFQIATITNNISGPIVAGNSFMLSWNPIAGMERYVVWIIGVDTNGTAHFYGSYAEANETSKTIATNAGDRLVFGLVIGFRICNQSPPSAIATHISPA